MWLKIPIDRAVLINSAVEAGFIFHHAETSYVMLTLWLPATESTLPANASHQVWISAVQFLLFSALSCPQQIC